jgi:DNA-binding transcriptional regulator YiaG
VGCHAEKRERKQNAWKSLNCWASVIPLAVESQTAGDNCENVNDHIQQGYPLTGPELKQLRKDLSDALGKQLSAADMARLCGLAPGGGADTIRRWEVSGPSGPADKLLCILAMASDRYPILENFNVFDRFNIPETERPARRQEFREKMRDEIRERLE